MSEKTIKVPFPRTANPKSGQYTALKEVFGVVVSGAKVALIGIPEDPPRTKPCAVSTIPLGVPFNRETVGGKMGVLPNGDTVFADCYGDL